MGYGGRDEGMARTSGRSDDNGVINQDLLGFDQTYIQAKRYADGNNISAGDIRDFFGALSQRKRRKVSSLQPITSPPRRCKPQKI